MKRYFSAEKKAFAYFTFETPTTLNLSRHVSKHSLNKISTWILHFKRHEDNPGGNVNFSIIIIHLRMKYVLIPVTYWWQK